IIRAMVAGERALPTLAALRHDRCHKAIDEIPRALTGTWREEPLFVLTHALALVDCSTAQCSACGLQVAPAFSVIQPRCEPAPEAPMPPRPTTPLRVTRRMRAPSCPHTAHTIASTPSLFVSIKGARVALFSPRPRP